MQRTDPEGVIISCDFCGTDWDPYDQSNARPMVEGHQGSIICLECLKSALPGQKAPSSPYRCSMCIRENLPLDLTRWYHTMPVPSEGLNTDAVICKECIEQAAGKFSKDPDVAWTWEKKNGEKN